MTRAEVVGRPPGFRALRRTGAPVHVALYRAFESRPLLVDTFLIAVPLTLIATYYSWLNAGLEFAGGPLLATMPAAPLLEVVTVLPLALRRVRPGVCAGIIAFGALCQVFTLIGPGFSIVSVPMAVYAASKFGTRRVSRGYLALALIGAVLLGGYFAVNQLRWDIYNEMAVSYSSSLLSPDRLIQLAFVAAFAAAVVLVSWLFGDLAGRRHREQNAIAERNQLLEKERDHEARLAADAERMRIAREMHDVVSHSMSVMIAQADGGRYVVHHDAERAGEAFETIGETGRQALTEMRRMLGVLREERAQLAMRPAPGLPELPRLFEDVRAAGVEVTAEVLSGPATASRAPGESGETGESPADIEELLAGFPALPEGMGLAVYRIVQEALTNTMKHAGRDARSRVALWIDREAHPVRLGLRVSDDGLGTRAARDGAGSGLLGMQERAALYGGTVQARPHSGGFTIAAWFPLPG